MKMVLDVFMQVEKNKQQPQQNKQQPQNKI